MHMSPSSENQRSSLSKPNRLIHEKSPYLLEHAYNPVDWFPWGQEAFEKAKSENKPIFLSIGYSACHWCHVFRRESLEDTEIAAILNSNFISIKVDREERPDVDEIYMKAVTSMTGSGGWPLNVFLTPSLEPIFGGTYFPPVASHGLPAFRTILKGISDAWQSDREKIVESANEMKRSLVEIYSNDVSARTNLDDSILDLCFNELATIFDQKNGGFGGAPKFPSPSNLFFLLRYHKKTGSKAPLLMVSKTLDHMARGGIYDHIGGGFHRYSTDREWLVPHFEKMLYDNALLSQAYTEAYLVTREEFYKEVSTETLDWILREMRSSDGGFFSAQDADSPDGEGSYYVWNKADVLSALAKSSNWKDKSKLDRVSEIVCKYYGITENGNFEEGKSILTISSEREKEISSEYSISIDELKNLIGEAKLAMREFRMKRPRPLTDDKVLTNWNGLIISALAKGYQVFGREDFLSAAKASANFILEKLSKTVDGKPSKLIHRYRERNASVEGLLEDYAYFVNGLLDLYEADFELNYLRAAIDLSETMIKKFFDEKEGGFFFTEDSSSDLIARPKEGFDGALPSANSLAILALFRIGEISGSEEFSRKAEFSINSFSTKIERQPSAFAFMLSALSFKFDRPKEIVLSGDKRSKDFQELLGSLRTFFLPNSVIVYAEHEAADLTPLIKDRISRPGAKPKVFVCSSNVCKLPATSKEELLTALSN
jgi:uncharacterized protein YyaL (SSP411 family)